MVDSMGQAHSKGLTSYQYRRKLGAVRRPVQMRMSRETEGRITEASSKMLMTRPEFIEWLMYKYSAGLVIVAEEGAFLDGMLKAISDLAERRGAEAGEKAAIRALYDRGLIDSSLLR